ncbi:hypothetical protein Taro_047014 [Colocasia esculenta]|uniref:Uncharacterized protein n=1 Tax=Colocasia esculenta TaxID=4460 RepID=A0A843X6R5_COLES|nr:hypothetical protein [Colocasia esculenta]
MAFQPYGVFRVRGGSACGPSTPWWSEVSVLVVRGYSHLVVAWSRQVCRGLLPRVPAALAGEGLVIPTGPCLRDSPSYFIQLGARRRGSSVSDGLRRQAVAPCVVSSSESECCELLYLSE